MTTETVLPVTEGCDPRRLVEDLLSGFYVLGSPGTPIDARLAGRFDRLATSCNAMAAECQRIADMARAVEGARS